MDETDPLYKECLALLAETSIAEDERVEQVEELVRKTYGDQLANADLERLVLDLLWEHFEGVKRVRKTRIVETTATNPIKLPEAAYKPEARAKFRQAAPVTKKKQWVPLDEIDLPEECINSMENKTPYDMLREILGQETSDEDIERVLSHNEFDIGRTIDMLLKTLRGRTTQATNDEQTTKKTLLTRDQTAERVVCRYFLQTGSCLRGSDCMYSHDLSQRICRFWLQGKCMAGKNCVFLHQVPQEVIDKLNAAVADQPAAAPAVPNFAALPKLGSKRSKAPAPAPASPSPSTPLVVNPVVASRSVASQASAALAGQLNRGLLPIRAPMHMPWKEVDFLRNQEYVDLRLSARKWADLRNKYLQLATNSWSQNDPATAKHMSKKGQEFNCMMLDDYEKARELLLEQRERPSSEVYLDLFGLNLEEAIEFLGQQLTLLNDTTRHNPRIAYVVCGRGHYKVKRYLDSLSQQVVLFLDRHGYLHKNFGDDATFGRVIGVDPYSALPI